MEDAEYSDAMAAVRSEYPWASIERNVATFTAGYFLAIAGELAPAARRNLDRLDSNLGANWPQEVERIYGMRCGFAQELYASLAEHFRPLEAIGFVLRGLRVPRHAALIRELIAAGGPCGPHHVNRPAAGT